MRITPASNLVDWTLLVLVIALAATGLATGVAGTPDTWWVFAAHGTLAMAFGIVLVWKLVRVANRLRPKAWDQGTKTSVAVTILALGSLATGIAWTLGAPIWVNGVSVVTVHAVLGLLIIPAIVFHLRHRYHGLSPTDVSGRRTTLRYLVLGGVAATLWWLNRQASTVIGLTARFTGSRLRGRHTGNDYPRTEWAADNPAPVDPTSWTLTVRGAVQTPVSLTVEDLVDPAATTEAVLDCTSGWYTIQDWRGRRLTDLLETAGITEDATHVSVISVTGYRWTFDLQSIEDLLLATHVEDERLTHAHGYPLRLVAPGHRGYRWVKWVEEIRVRRRPDPGKWVAIFVSGFD